MKSRRRAGRTARRPANPRDPPPDHAGLGRPVQAALIVIVRPGTDGMARFVGDLTGLDQGQERGGRVPEVPPVPARRTTAVRRDDEHKGAARCLRMRNLQGE